jgi:inhibitor of KinA
MDDRPRIFSLGDDCVTVDFGNEISIDRNSKAVALAERLNEDGFSGFIEAVPAYSSVSVFFNLAEIRRSTEPSQTAVQNVQRSINSALERLTDKKQSETKIVEIAVDFGDDAGLDLKHVADSASMSTSEVIELFISKTYRVFMIGFLPGFAYMGEVDERIATPRRATPRTSVPQGSVGIAGRQTGIYPFQSPGGWQIIGRTSEQMFSLDREPNSLLRPGDEVRFVDGQNHPRVV